MKGGHKPPVAIIQGYGAPTFTNLPIKLRLQNDHFQVFDVPLPGLNTQDIRHSAQTVADTVLSLQKKTGAPKLDLIGVSMGGLIGLYYIRKLEGVKHIRRFISLGTPFYGTTFASIAHFISGQSAPGAEQMRIGSDFMRELHEQEPTADCEVVSILARGDLFVTKKSAHLRGSKLILSPHGDWPLGHYSPIIYRRNYEIIKEELLR